MKYHASTSRSLIPPVCKKHNLQGCLEYSTTMEISHSMRHHDAEKSASPENREVVIDSSTPSEQIQESRPHLHAKTFLAVAAMCLIYIAQLVSLVGAGAVSYVPVYNVSLN